MARPATVAEDELLDRLSAVFRDLGFAGASLGALSAASGLGRASLYHRFPRGKEQMATEVIAAALGWYEAHVFAPLRAEGPPRARVAAAAQALDAFYESGGRACLLNVMAASATREGPFGPAIRTAFEALLAAFAGVSMDAGHAPDDARGRAGRAVARLQGSLVLARGLGTSAPFSAFLNDLPGELIGPADAGGEHPR